MNATTKIARAEQMGYWEGFAGSAPSSNDPFGPDGVFDRRKSDLWQRGFTLGRSDQQAGRELRSEYWPDT